MIGSYETCIVVEQRLVLFSTILEFKKPSIEN